MAGSLARELTGPAEVTIRRPVRLERAFTVRRLEHGGVALLDRDELIAEGVPAAVELPVPQAPAFDAVRAASGGFRGAPHHNPDCFGCSVKRAPADGLGLRPVRCAGFDGAASLWVPDAASVAPGGTVRPEFLWAALDCPGAYALAHPSMVLLGRIAARIDRAPQAGERLRALGWPLGREGRKLHVGSALVDEDGFVIAVARAVWIELRSGVWERMRG